MLIYSLSGTRVLTKYLMLLVLSHKNRLKRKAKKKKNGKWAYQTKIEELLTLICKKKCIPFIRAGAYTVRSENGKALIPLVNIS